MIIITHCWSTVEKSGDGSKGLFVKERPDEAFYAPSLIFQNCVEITEEDVSFKIFDDNPSDPAQPAVVCMWWELTGVFQGDFRLHRFPMDVQILTIILLSKREPLTPREGSSGLELLPNISYRYRSLCNPENFGQKDEYKQHPQMLIRREKTSPLSSMSGKEYSKLCFDVFVERNYSYWIWNALTPLLVITTSIFCAFAVPDDQVADRFQVCLTVLLTLIAFKFALLDKLPRVSYHTTLDVYILACLAMAFSTLMIIFLASDTLDAISLDSKQARTFAIVAASTWVTGSMTYWLAAAIFKERRLSKTFWRNKDNRVWLGRLNPSIEKEDVSRQLRVFLRQFGTLKRVVVWEGEDAESVTCLCQNPYLSNHRFAVAEFRTAEEAQRAVASTAAPDCRSTPFTIEALQPAWSLFLDHDASLSPEAAKALEDRVTLLAEEC